MSEITSPSPFLNPGNIPSKSGDKEEGSAEKTPQGEKNEIPNFKKWDIGRFFRRLFFRESDPVPVTVLTGYLGAGKTTVILNLMKQSPKGYAIAWLKNEMGNTAVDTELADTQKTTMVKEMLQGCICHTLIGNLGSALEELLDSRPNRIIIETSGSATPAPIVWEIRKNPRLLVDGVVTVVDAENFNGYVNKSPSLSMQAKYTDLILINKHEGLDQRILEDNLNDLYEINLDTPKIFTDYGSVSLELLFGLGSGIFLTQASLDSAEQEVDAEHQGLEADVLELCPERVFIFNETIAELEKFPKKNFYRIKGVIETNEGQSVVNCAFGRCTLTALSKESNPRLVCMGEELEDFIDEVCCVFGAKKENAYLIEKGHSHHH